MPKREVITKLLAESGLGQFQEALLAHALPAIQIEVEPYEEDTDLPVGHSKLGGLPDFPPGMAWPRVDGEPLWFVAQIRLADIASQIDSQAYQLPQTGMLYFFYADFIEIDYIIYDQANGYSGGIYGDIEKEDEFLDDEEDAEEEESFPNLWELWGSQVLFFDGDLSTLQNTTPPDDLDETNIFAPCQLQMTPTLTLPDVFDLQLFYRLGISQEKTSDVFDHYIEFWDRLDDVYESESLSQILGYPRLIQGDVMVEAESFRTRQPLETLITAYSEDPQSPVNDWILLLQVDSEAETDMMWGDAGCLYFCIRKEDLAKRQFDKAVCIMQCY